MQAPGFKQMSCSMSIETEMPSAMLPALARAGFRSTDGDSDAQAGAKSSKSRR